MENVSSKPRAFRNTGLLPLVRLEQDECKWPVSQNAKALGGPTRKLRLTRRTAGVALHARLTPGCRAGFGNGVSHWVAN